jgi:phthalate 4,5-dioxygenase oxygenase subunit
MLSREDNELLTRTDAGTPMGALIRQYWIPVVTSGELVAGGRVKRVKLLGERLIAFRAKNGRPGLIGEFCPHRLASLYFGRVEDAGMRCVYHGWAFGMDGRCLEMPNEPGGGFCSKIRHAGYPCEERGGMIFAYMGPASPPPPMPHLEWTLLPDSHSFASKRVQECNWFQAMEGGIDSSHISFLHAPLDHADAEVTRELDAASFGVGSAVQTADRAPRFDVVDTDYGVLIGAQRSRPDGSICGASPSS